MCAVNRALKIRPEAFDPIRMNRAANVFFGMIDNFVRVARVQAAKGRRFVGIENRARFDVMANHTLKRLGLLVGVCASRESVRGVRVCQILQPYRRCRFRV